MKFLREYTISTHAPAGGATEAQAGYIPCNQDFYSRPCGRGDGGGARAAHGDVVISTHAPAGGATVALSANALREVFLLTPLREGRRKRPTQNPYPSRFLLTPLREGRLIDFRTTRSAVGKFLLTPLREGRPKGRTRRGHGQNFYSRPCGRGDGGLRRLPPPGADFYSRPCGRGDSTTRQSRSARITSNFYSRPCGRGDRARRKRPRSCPYFYSRPCGRGDIGVHVVAHPRARFLLTPLREGRPASRSRTR